MEPTMPETTDNVQHEKKHELSRAELLREFGQLPDEALVDDRTGAALVDSGVSTFWARVGSDPDAPRPIKLSARCTRFRVGDLRRYIKMKAGETLPA